MADAPPITRIGVKANFFDTEIKGAPDTGGFETGPFTIGDIVIPPEMGLFQKMIGVQWATGKFLLVSGDTTLHSFDIDGFDFPWNSFSCISGASKDGQDWKGGAGFTIGGNAAGRGTDGGSVFECGIRGKQQFFAGGFTVEIIGETGQPGVFRTAAVPVVAFSDDGVSWSPEGLPSINPEFDSRVTAVTYDPNIGTFTAYVLGTINAGGDTQTAAYSFSESDFKAPSSDANDKPLRIVNTGVTPGFAFPSGDFVSCCLDGQTMKFKTADGAGTMQLTGNQTSLQITIGKTTTTTAPSDTNFIISAAVNSDGSAIVAAVMDNNSGGGENDPIPEPHVYVSTNQGGNWQATFSAATGQNQDNSEAFGSISFS